MSTSNQASAPSTQDGKEAWGKLISFNPNLENIVLYKDAFSIGRNPTNDVKISDIKLSGIHCKIYKDEGGCWIEDLSSNGTYVDNDLIGKGNKRKITSGDKLYILHPNKVKKEEVMGYVFSAMATENSGELKRKREEELKTLEEEKKKSEKQIKFQEELGEEMQCSICIDYIYHCITTIPCLHNFCAACFSDWMQKSQVCPQCREEVVEVKKNNTVNNIIEKFMENNPTKKRPKEEYEEMDKKNKIKEDRLVLKNKTNPTQPVSNPVRAAAPPAATHFNPLAHTVVNMFNPNPLPTFVSTANAASRVNYFAPVPAPTTASSIFTNRIPATGSHARGMRARGGRAGARNGGGRDSAYRPYNRGRYGRYGYGSDDEYDEEEEEDEDDSEEDDEESEESEYSD